MGVGLVPLAIYATSITIGVVPAVSLLASGASYAAGDQASFDVAFSNGPSLGHVVLFVRGPFGGVGRPTLAAVEVGAVNSNVASSASLSAAGELLWCCRRRNRLLAARGNGSQTPLYERGGSMSRVNSPDFSTR